MASKHSGGELVLVTGATGFLAAHVVEHLLRGGYRVRGTVRSLKPSNPKKLSHLLGLQAEYGEARLQLVEADLLNRGCWRSVVDGCTFVAHVASPAPAQNPKSEDDLIKPAVDGTSAVLEACNACRSVRRVVVTSSRSAVAEGYDGPHAGKRADPQYVFTEEDWSDLGHARGWAAYIKSKTLAERKAWELAKSASYELVVINPAFIIGPVLGCDVGTSAGLIQKLLRRDLPGCLRLSFDVVHTDDVAAAHVRALQVPEAAGQRFLVCSGRLMWMSEIAQLLSNSYSAKGFNVPTFELPNFFVRLLGVVNPTVRMAAPNLSRWRLTSNVKAQEVLNIRFKSSKQAIIDCADSLIESGLAKPAKKSAFSKLLGFICLAGAVAGVYVGAATKGYVPKFWA